MIVIEKSLNGDDEGAEIQEAVRNILLAERAIISKDEDVEFDYTDLSVDPREGIFTVLVSGRIPSAE